MNKTLLSSFPRFRPRTKVSEDEIYAIVNESKNNGGVVDFSGADLSEDTSPFIADFLESNQLLSSVTVINLSDTSIQSKALDSLLNLHFISLQELLLSNNFLSGKEIGASLANLLSNGESCLEELKLSGNKLGDVGMKSMCAAFNLDLSSSLSRGPRPSLLSLKVLDLSNNGLTDVSALSLCRGLLSFAKRCMASKQNAKLSLDVLKLDGNNFTDNAALCLAQLLQTNYGLTKNNIQASAFQLSELSVNDNQIEEKGLTALLLAVTDCLDYSLKSLKMARNIPSVALIDQIANLLSYNVALSSLEVDFTKECAMDVVEDPDYPASVSSLLSAFTSQTSRLVDLSLGHLYTVTKQGASEDSEKGKKLMKVVYDFDSLGDILRKPAALPSVDTGKDVAEIAEQPPMSDSSDVIESVVGAIEEIMTVDDSEIRNQNNANTTAFSSPSPSHSSFNDDAYIEKEFERMRSEQARRFQAMSTEIKRLIQPKDRLSPSYSPSALQQRYEQSLTPNSQEGWQSPIASSPRRRNMSRKNASVDPSVAVAITEEVNSEQQKKSSPLKLKGSDSPSPPPPPPTTPKRPVSASWENLPSVTNNNDGTITITADVMKAIINTAVTTALESAHKNWYLEHEMIAAHAGTLAKSASENNNNLSHSVMPTSTLASSPSSSLSRQQAVSLNRSYTRLPSSSYNLHSNVANNSNNNNNNNSTTIIDKKGRVQEYESSRQMFELEKKINKLENRLGRLEGQFDVDDSSIESGFSPTRGPRGGTNVIKNILNRLDKMKDLEDRIDTVEDAIEKEHQSSLQILDMLMDAEKKRQQRQKNEQELLQSSALGPENAVSHSAQGNTKSVKSKKKSESAAATRVSRDSRFRV